MGVFFHMVARALDNEPSSHFHSSVSSRPMRHDYSKEETRENCMYSTNRALADKLTQSAAKFLIVRPRHESVCVRFKTDGLLITGVAKKHKFCTLIYQNDPLQLRVLLESVVQRINGCQDYQRLFVEGVYLRFSAEILSSEIIQLTVSKAPSDSLGLRISDTILTKVLGERFSPARERSLRVLE